MATSLDPQTLQQLLLLMQQPGMEGNGATEWAGTGDMSNWLIDRRPDIIGRSNDSMDAEDILSDPITRFYRGVSSDRWKTNGDVSEVFDDQGNFLGVSSGDSEALSLAKFIAMSAAAGYGTGADFGGGAAGGLEMSNGAFLGEGVSSGVGAWDSAAINSAIGSGELGTAASYAGQNLANGTASDTLGSMMNSGSTASKAGNAANLLKDGANAAGTGLNLGGVLGAVAGAASSQDQEKTSSVEPWKDAQPFLRDLLAQGQQLSAQYQAQPFNQAQKTGLSNMGQLYDFANQNAGGLLQGFHQNAAGNNQFVRGQPQRLLQGAGPAVGTFNPGSYGNFLG